jgi:hypothetical protein
MPQMIGARQYDPLDPVKCFQSHFKILVLKNYEGGDKDVDLAKFFILNAKVLKAIKFLVKGKVDLTWVVDQHRLLEVGTRASRDAQFEFRSGSGYKCVHTHDLPIADPFNICYGVYGGDTIREMPMFCGWPSCQGTCGIDIPTWHMQCRLFIP